MRMEGKMKESVKVIGTIIGAVLLVALCGWGIYAFKVATSPVKGAGDTVIKNNSVDNRTKAQERFRALYAAIVRNQQNVVIAAKTTKDHPNDRIARTNYDGAVQICVSSVADYNAETGKVLSQDWLPADLPKTISDSACYDATVS